MLGNMADEVESSNKPYSEFDGINDGQVGGEQARMGAEKRAEEEESMGESCLPSSSEWTSALTSNIDDLLNSLQPSTTESLADS